ncbi:putative 1-acyl-sn-glycerol-3-phosphate acyltransferase [Candidatus Rickettsiella viridis]|uniref:Putative 1-acyl-sn-glycerol-3-phosphate acyltransferase n=1 Tax=Candidatus Rickettsiella viridis TaxID=676208 RepID=A0A2Z5UTD8_9COXI|nr:acyltransferase [Candidatus Rickettsiella viridis]BBB14694.1 putative 1-acyl-sn-glycerol-3-phosphate acyltransferase [Candidatus Rickettsiella viridis]
MILFNGLRAAIAAILYLINLIILFVPLAILGLFCYLFPLKIWQRKCKCWMEHLPVYWIKGNYLIQELTTSIKWEVKGLDKLSYNEWYLLISNHQSWADILVLQRIFNQKIPPLKFFLKRELLWTLPFASWACWLLGFPFMHRYSKKVLAKHPELKNKDVEATKRACIRFKAIPTTVANFIEGTRFSEKKRQSQQSPYQYLLRPKSTGIGFSLAVLGDFFHKILNVTIIYPPKKSGLFHFLSGDIKKITVEIEAIPITSDWIGDYQNDRQFRASFQRKLNYLWEQKDELIKRTQARY